MKIAAFGDAHIHEYKEFSKNLLVAWNDEEGRFVVDEKSGYVMNSRLFTSLNALVWMRLECIKRGIDKLLFTGDMFHKRSSVSTVVFNSTRRVLETFMTFPTPIHLYGIPGNHDLATNEVASEHSLYGMKEHMTLMSGLDPVHIGGLLYVIGIPFIPNVDVTRKLIKEAVKNAGKLRKTNKKSKIILLAHIGVTGAYVGKNSYVMEDAFTAEDLCYEDFDWVVCGHYHKFQVIKGADNMLYTGSLIQNNFNDEGEPHGFVVIDTDEKTVELAEIPAPKFYTLTSELSGSKEIRHDKDYIRLQAKPEDVEILVGNKGKLSDVTNIRVEVQKEYESDQRLDITISTPLPDIVRTYADFNEKSPDLGLSILQEFLESR